MAENRNTLISAARFYSILIIFCFSSRTLFAQKEANTATSKLAVLSENLTAENISEIRRLVDAGADVNVKNKYGATPIYMASENGQTEIVKLLLAANADVNTAEPILGTTPLMAACMDGFTEVVKLLLTANPEMNIVDNTNGWTALTVASIEGNPEVVKLLLAANADVNIAGKRKGMTPLIAASMRGYTEIVKLLLAAGANINAKMEINGEKNTALQIAETSGNAEIVRLLKEYSGNQ